MRDKISEQRINELHPRIRDEAKQTIEEVERGFPANVAVRVTESYRSFKRSDQLYARGRTTPGPIVTNAKGGESIHNYRFAFDYCIIIDKDGNGTWDELDWNTAKDRDKDGVSEWREVANAFVKKGWRWGADWDRDGVTKAQGDKDEHLVDAPHLEKTFGHDYRSLLKLYNEKKFISGTEYLNI